MADLHWYQGRYEEAEPLYERALGIVELLLAIESSNLGWSETEIRALFLLDHEHQARERASFLLENDRIRPGIRSICLSLGLPL